jgi:hypothetical protein
MKKEIIENVIIIEEEVGDVLIVEKMDIGLEIALMKEGEINVLIVGAQVM